MPSNTRFSKKASSLVMGSSMILMGLLPAASAFAASAPSVSLQASALTAQPGGSVTFTATANGVTNPEYQFWVEQPNGNWVVGQNWSTSNTYTLSNVTNGDYLVTAYVLGQSQLMNHDWSAATNAEANGQQAVDGVFVNSQVTVSTTATSVTQGQTITVTAAASNIYDPLYQFWYKAPDGQWYQSGDYSSNSVYSFTAPLTGTYEIVAYAKSPLALNNPEGALMSQSPATVTVQSGQMGQPQLSAITVSGESFGNGTSSSPDIAMSGSSLTLSTTLMDAAGNPMPGVEVTYLIYTNNQSVPIGYVNGQAIAGTSSTVTNTWNFEVPTNASGQAVLQLQGPAGQTVAYSAEAQAPYAGSSGQIMTTTPVYLEFVAANSAGISPSGTSSDPYQTNVGTVVPVTVTLPPVNGGPQQNVPVTFTVAPLTGDPTVYFSTSGGGSIGSSVTVDTNSAGQATAYVDSQSSGSATVSASSTTSTPSVNSSTVIDWTQTGLPAELANVQATNVQSGSVSSGYYAQTGNVVTLMATVENAEGNPMPGAQVFLAAVNSGGVSNDNGTDAFVSGSTTTDFPEVNAGALTSSLANSSYGELLTANSAGQISAQVTNSALETDFYYLYAVNNGFVQNPITQTTGNPSASGTAAGGSPFMEITWTSGTTLYGIAANGVVPTVSNNALPSTQRSSSVTGLQANDEGYFSGTVTVTSTASGTLNTVSGLPISATSPVSVSSITNGITNSPVSVSSLTNVPYSGSIATAYFTPMSNSNGNILGASEDYTLTATNGAEITEINGMPLSNPATSLTLDATYSASSGWTYSVPGNTNPIPTLSGSEAATFAVGVTAGTADNVGPATLTVSCGTVSATAQIQLEATSPSYVLNFPSQITFTPGQYQTVSYTVEDIEGNPVPDVATTLLFDGNETGLWITSVNGVSLQQNEPLANTVAEEPTPIPLYNVTSPSALNYSTVDIAGVVSWSSSSPDQVTLYSNGSGQVSLTMQTSPVSYWGGSGTAGAVYGSTGGSGTVNVWTWPKGTAPVPTSTGVTYQVYIGQSTPNSAMQQIGTISW
ncbi:MAG: regulator [Sulfobacillus sp.]|nr:regulator [Sulfobacillus sp.]